jgi:hypothetical protein
MLASLALVAFAAQAPLAQPAQQPAIEVTLQQPDKAWPPAGVERSGQGIAHPRLLKQKGPCGWRRSSEPTAASATSA